MKKIVLFFAVLAAAAVSACQYGEYPFWALHSYRLPYIAKVNGTSCASVTTSTSSAGETVININNTSGLTTSPTFTVTVGVAAGDIGAQFFSNLTQVGILRLPVEGDVAVYDASIQLRLSYSLAGYGSGTVRSWNFTSTDVALLQGLTLPVSLPYTPVSGTELTLTLEVIAGTPSIGATMQFNTIDLFAGAYYYTPDAGETKYFLGWPSVSDLPASAGHRLTLTVTGTRRPEASK